DGDKSLSKISSTGEVSTALSTGKSSASDSEKKSFGWKPKLPRIMTIAVSPKLDLYLHFEYPFKHKESDGTQGGGWEDGAHCQIFLVNGSLTDLKAGSAPSASNLTCLSYTHMIDNWSAGRLSVFQFDSEGNVYFPGRLHNAPNMVIYKRARGADGTLTEMINSNICVQDFMVTKSSGIFYTGVTGCQNGGGGGGDGGFFRYVKGGTNGALTEIARGWWNFVYEAIQSATTDQAVFFGPDPRSASAASWNSACLFRFNPEAGSTTAERTSEVITCGDNIWNWLNMSRAEDVTAFGSGFGNNNEPTTAWKTEYKARCTSSGQTFAGGGSQISAIKQDAGGNIFVIGNVRVKKAGTLSCSVETRGPHCKLSGYPNPTYTTSATCTAVSGTWVDDGSCSDYTKTTSATCLAVAGNTWNRNSTWYGESAGDICTQSGAVAGTDWWSSDNTKSFMSVTSAADHTIKHRVSWFNCAAPASNSGGDQWTSEYKGLAKVVAATKTLTLMSSTAEQAIDLFLVNDMVYFTAYNTTSGKYQLRYFDGATSTTTTILDNFEVYKLSESPLGKTEMLIAGLDFATNTYKFGSLLVASPYTLTAKTGLTGTLKAVVIFPK
ncbi:MAG: hypothetical protein AAB425_06170, partial [Bdellovibrionota bacterium]